MNKNVEQKYLMKLRMSLVISNVSFVARFLKLINVVLRLERGRVFSEEGFYSIFQEIFLNFLKFSSTCN